MFFFFFLKTFVVFVYSEYLKYFIYFEFRIVKFILMKEILKNTIYFIKDYFYNFIKRVSVRDMLAAQISFKIFFTTAITKMNL